LLAEADKAAHDVEKHKGEKRDGEEPQGMSNRKKDDSYGEGERAQPHGLSRLG
jgi:hypothetical protein